MLDAAAEIEPETHNFLSSPSHRSQGHAIPQNSRPDLLPTTTFFGQGLVAYYIDILEPGLAVMRVVYPDRCAVKEEATAR